MCQPLRPQYKFDVPSSLCYELMSSTYDDLEDFRHSNCQFVGQICVQALFCRRLSFCCEFGRMSAVDIEVASVNF